MLDSIADDNDSGIKHLRSELHSLGPLEAPASSANFRPSLA